MNPFRTLPVLTTFIIGALAWSPLLLACNLKAPYKSDLSTTSIQDVVQNRNHCLWALTEVHFFKNAEPYLRLSDSGGEISNDLAAFSKEQEPSFKTADGDTPLHLALRFENRVAVASYAPGKSLLCHPRSNEFINLKNKEGDTAMSLAAQLSSPQYAMLLFRYGGRVDSRNAEGKTPIDIAREHGYSKTQRFLEHPAKEMLEFGQLLSFFVPIVRNGKASTSLNEAGPICPNSL